MVRAEPAATSRSSHGARIALVRLIFDKINSGRSAANTQCASRSARRIVNPIRSSRRSSGFDHQGKVRIVATFELNGLGIDPGKIALGTADSAKLSAAEGNANGPACHAALAGYRTALMFRVLFTGLVFAVSLASATALIIAIATIVKNGADVGNVVAGVSGVLGSAATLWLANKMNEAIKVQRTALADVGKYCGITIQSQVK